MKKVFSILLVAVLILSGCQKNFQEDITVDKLSLRDADATLASYIKKLDVTIGDPPIDLDSGSIYTEDLPDLDKTYPLSVVGKADVVVEIWMTTERSGEGNDGWGNRVAENFNTRRPKLSNGKTVAFSIRAIDAGAQVDYVNFGGYRPDVVSFSNGLWSRMIASKGINIQCIAERTVGNTAGILMSRAAYDAFINSHGSVNLEDLRSDIRSKKITFGWTNPYTSDTALNMLCEMLLSIDTQNPVSERAEREFFELQKDAPQPAYTTAQMRESARRGFVDVMVMEAQAYSNTPELRDFVFTPFGVRHDNPMYVFDNLSPEKREAIEMFIAYYNDMLPGVNDAIQKLGTQMGFNQHNDYVGTESLSGTQLYQAQALWKKNKTGGRPTVGVFVADVSNSMVNNGGLVSLKQSLVNSTQVINEDSEIGLVSFSGDFVIELPIGQFQGTHRAMFTGAVKNLKARGTTHIYSSILVALDMIREHRATHDYEANYMIILLTDGADMGGVKESVALQLLASYGVSIHVFGYSDEADMNALRRLIEATEGTAKKVTEDNIRYELKNLFNSQM